MAAAAGGAGNGQAIETSLFDAVYAGDLEAVKAALDSGANVMARDDEQNTPLHIATENGNVQIALALLEKGANPFAFNNKSKTPLGIAGNLSEPTIFFYFMIDIDHKNPDPIDASIETYWYDPRHISGRNARKSAFEVKNVANMNAIADPEEKKRMLFRNDPLYTLYDAETFPSAPDGIYLWIYSHADGFHAIRVYSVLEVGTKHLAIIKRLQERLGKDIHIRFAGELQKTGTEVKFNILSGSFMFQYLENMVDNYGVPGLLFTKYNIISAQNKLKSVLPGITVNLAEDLMDTLITENIGGEERERLEARGFTVIPKIGGGRRFRRTRRTRRIFRKLRKTRSRK